MSQSIGGAACRQGLRSRHVGEGERVQQFTPFSIRGKFQKSDVSIRAPRRICWQADA
jgi:hypothetical protein